MVISGLKQTCYIEGEFFLFREKKVTLGMCKTHYRKCIPCFYLSLYCIDVLLIDIFYLGETLFFDRRYGNVNFLNNEMLKDIMKCCFVKRWSYM